MEQTARFSSAGCEFVPQQEFNLTLAPDDGSDTKVTFQASAGESLCVKKTGWAAGSALTACVGDLQALIRTGTGQARLDDYEHGFGISVNGDGRNFSIDWWVNLWIDDQQRGIRVGAGSVPLEPDAVHVLYEALRRWNLVTS